MLSQGSDKNHSQQFVYGKIIKITGTVVDVQFPEGQVPKINSCLIIEIPENDKKKSHKARLEVALQLGDDIVRCIAIENIHGISRNLPVYDTGSPITVPVGNEVLGRMFNVLGQTIDGLPEITTNEKWSIHREAPDFTEQKIEYEILETGIKVIDLMCPYIKGSKIGLFGGAGVGKNSFSN